MPTDPEHVYEALENGASDTVAGIARRVFRKSPHIWEPDASPVDQAVRAEVESTVKEALDRMVREGTVQEHAGHYTRAVRDQPDTTEARIVVSTDHGPDAVGIVLHHERDEVIGTIPDTRAREIAEEQGLAALAELVGLPLSPDANTWNIAPSWEMRIGGGHAHMTSDAAIDGRNRLCGYVWTRIMAELVGLRMSRSEGDALAANTILRMRSDAAAVDPDLPDWWEYGSRPLRMDPES